MRQNGLHNDFALGSDWECQYNVAKAEPSHSKFCAFLPFWHAVHSRMQKQMSLFQYLMKAVQQMAKKERQIVLIFVQKLLISVFLEAKVPLWSR